MRAVLPFPPPAPPPIPVPASNQTSGLKKQFPSSSRRNFVKKGGSLLGGAIGMPYFIPASALGRGGATPPSERITLAAIGLGGRSLRALMPHFLPFKEVQIVAACDCWEARLEAGRKVINEHYGNEDCRGYAQIPEVLARPDIDAVVIATGDRMHAVASIMAAKAGKDIYCEKPHSLTIGEGQALVTTTERHGSIYQCGHQRRSVDVYQFQEEVVRRGLIGKPHTVVAQVWENPVVKPEADLPNPPEGLDWETWLGPTPYHPFNPARLKWNYFFDTGAGILAAMGCHYTDIAQWGLDKDHTNPVSYTGSAYFDPNNYADTPISSKVTCTYADGVKLILDSQGTFKERFIRFVGDEGWIQVDDETGLVTAEPKSILKMRPILERHYNDMDDHVSDFLNCIRTRKPTICNPENSHRATTITHNANICIRLGRDLKWDPLQEKFIDDAEANRMMSRGMRPPWHL